MQIAIENKLIRWVVTLSATVLFLLAVGWITRTYVAGAYASRLSEESLQRAIRLDPGNASYHLQLGGLYEYMPTEAQPEKAMLEFQRAAELSPYDPSVWINLGGAAEFSGHISEAEKYLREADYLAPRIPMYQWRIANFYLLHGNVSEAFAHFNKVLAGTREYDQAVFGTAWKASGDAPQILQQLVPKDLPAEFSYLYFLVAAKRFSESADVWKRILDTPGKFQPNEVNGYIENLVWNRRPEEAFEVWQDLQKKGLLRISAPKADRDVITNGSFEDDLLNTGFTWRISPAEDVFAGLDTTNYHSASHALLVLFSGKQNLDYRNVYQYVKVEPGKNYRLQAFLKADRITTDSGPRLEVRDFYEPGALDKFTDDVTGSTESWSSVLLDFRTGPKTELVAVILARLPSAKLDNQIAGKVWLDDVSLTPLP